MGIFRKKLLDCGYRILDEEKLGIDLIHDLIGK
jgi:hypothetical protein